MKLSKVVIIGVLLVIVYAVFSSDNERETTKTVKKEQTPNTIFQGIVEWAKEYRNEH